MKFKSNTTGTVLEPRSRMVEEQLAKSAEYSPYKAEPAAKMAEPAKTGGN